MEQDGAYYTIRLSTHIYDMSEWNTRGQVIDFPAPFNVCAITQPAVLPQRRHYVYFIHGPSFDGYDARDIRLDVSRGSGTSEWFYRQFRHWVGRPGGQ